MLRTQKISASALMAILLLQALLFAFHQASADSNAKSEKQTELSVLSNSGTAEGHIANSPSIPGSGFASLNQKRYHSGFQDREFLAPGNSIASIRYAYFSETEFKIFLQSYRTISLHLFYCVLQI